MPDRLAMHRRMVAVPVVCPRSPTRAPAALLAGSRGEVALERGSCCWQSFTPNAQGSFVGLCAGRAAFEPDARLVVTSGETLPLCFSAMAPTDVHLQRGETSTPLTAGNPVRFSHYVRLGVHAASPGRIALTG